MTVLDDILKDNKKFTDEFNGVELPHHPQKKIAILSCMDCRLINFLYPALGLEKGDAKVITNAGNTIVGEDPIRSLAVAVYALGAEEILVVGHTQCGMSGVDIDNLKSKMIEAGIQDEDIGKYDLAQWVGGFESEEENVINSCEKIKNHPLIPDVPVHGLIIDIVTGKLKVLQNGY